MSKVKLDLSDLTPKEKSDLAAKVVEKCTADAAFTSISELIVALGSANAPLVTVLDTIAEVEHQLRVLILQRDPLVNAVDVALTAASSGVESVAKGEKSVVEASGFDATSERSTPQPLGQVENLSLSLGDEPGELDGQWDALPRKMAYEAQWTLTPNDAASWKPLALDRPTRSRATFHGLPSGQNVWVHVRGLGGSTGTGPWSHPVMHIVP